MKILTVEEHRSRIENLRFADETVKKCYRRHRIHNYIPGQVFYHLGSIPTKVPMAPTEYDLSTLKKLSGNGFEWVQIHCEWMDWIRRWGGDTYSSPDPAGTRKFIDACHAEHMKIIPYVSCSYFPAHDPDLREEFLGLKRAFVAGPMYLSSCSLGSPEWREYNMKRTMGVLDTYAFDGLYCDFGYDKFLAKCVKEWDTLGNADHANSEPLEYDPEAEDYLGMIYSELRARGLLYKLHLGAFQPIPVKDKVYDYLWVGEAGKHLQDILKCKSFEPYLVPAFDRNSMSIEDPDLVYALTIPFMQFPILYYGRPVGMMERRNIEGVKYYTEVSHADAARDYYLAHPNGPYVYSEWSSIPDDPDDFSRAAAYLALYRPMVTEGSVVRMEIREASFIRSEIPAGVFLSMFTNESQYLVVSNTTGQPYRLLLSEPWRDRRTGMTGTEFTVPKNRILFLAK